MKNILKHIDIDLYAAVSYEVITAQQGDKNSRIIELSLYDRGEPYEPSGNITFRFIGHRGDGSSFLKEQEECITRNGNRISIKLLEDILYYDGIIEAKLVMYEGMSTPEGKVLSTIPFRISCIKNPYNDSNMEPGKYSIVTDLISKVDKFSESAQDYVNQAGEFARQAQSYAVGDTDFRDGEDSDNAKHYYGQSKSYAVGETGLRDGEDSDNAKYYYGQSKSYAVGTDGAVREHDNEDCAKHYCEQASAKAADAINKAREADVSAKQAQSYAVGGTGSRNGEDRDNAKYYHNQAKSYAVGTGGAVRENDEEDCAKYYYGQTKIHENDARQYSELAGQCAGTAEGMADIAGEKSTEAADYAAQAAASRDVSAQKASEASASAADAANSAQTIGNKAEQASDYARKAQSYANGTGGYRENEASDNAEYYYNQAKAISQSFAGALRPMGTYTFANLPALASAVEGNMYNVSDQFTTNSDFREGAGLTIPAGSNIYKTGDGKWDVLAGSPVTGIRGEAEPANVYRKGNVDITKANIGLGNVDNTADINKIVKGINKRPENWKTETDPPSSYPDGISVFFSSNGFGTGGYVVYTVKADTVMQFRWHNSSSAIGFRSNNSAVSWSSWTEVMDSYNIQFQTVSRANTADSATKATQDSAGNVIKDSYAVRKRITGGSFNDVIIPGIYFMENNTDSPQSGYDYGMLVLQTGSTESGPYVTQVAYKKNNASDIYIRSGYPTHNFPVRFYEWKKIYAEGNLMPSDIGALPVSGGTITGNLRLKGSGNYGNALNFGDGDYVHISEPTDDHLEIKGSYINFVTSGTGSGRFTLNGKDVLTIDQIYPIGSIYMSVNSTNPGTLFGGTWVSWGTGRVPVGIDTSQTEFSTVEKTGGSKVMHKHSHTTQDTSYGFMAYKSNANVARGVINSSGSTTRRAFTVPDANQSDLGYSKTTAETGTGTSGNLQPYITCYMWKRTA